MELNFNFNKKKKKTNLLYSRLYSIVCNFNDIVFYIFYIWKRCVIYYLRDKIVQINFKRNLAYLETMIFLTYTLFAGIINGRYG